MKSLSQIFCIVSLAARHACMLVKVSPCVSHWLFNHSRCPPSRLDTVGSVSTVVPVCAVSTLSTIITASTAIFGTSIFPRHGRVNA